MPKRFENNYFTVDTTLDKRKVRVSAFKNFHYHDEIELKEVSEEEIIKLIEFITDIYLEEKADD